MIEVGLAIDPDICVPLPLNLDALSPDKTDTLFPKADFYCTSLPVLVGCLGCDDSWSYNLYWSDFLRSQTTQLSNVAGVAIISISASLAVYSFLKTTLIPNCSE